MKNLKSLLAFFMLISTAFTSYAQWEDDEKIDCNHFGLFYTASFEYPDLGIAGIGGEFYGERFGGRFALGYNIDFSGVCFELGPSLQIPLNKNIGITTPLCLTVGTDGEEWNVGASLIPKFIFRTGKFSANLGAGGMYAGDQFAPGFTAGIAYDF